jgi:RimJ/RimL family protein N-acetyltransferase
VKQFLSNSVSNTLGQPVGAPLPGWSPPPRPPRETIEGRTCFLEPLDAGKHGADLYAANALDSDDSDWTYSAVGPYENESEFLAWARAAEKSSDPLYFAIIDRQTGKAVGTATYMRIDPNNGCIEVGTIKYSPLLQRTTAATEAMYLMMKRAFDLGYRRYEWKCDSHNAPSRKAAERLGFIFEGLFRQAVVYKGRNRDTTWFSIIDNEWPALRGAYEAWLAPENFDEQGCQKQRLSDLIAVARGTD